MHFEKESRKEDTRNRGQTIGTHTMSVKLTFFICTPSPAPLRTMEDTFRPNSGGEDLPFSYSREEYVQSVNLMRTVQDIENVHLWAFSV